MEAVDCSFATSFPKSRRQTVIIADFRDEVSQGFVIVGASHEAGFPLDDHFRDPIDIAADRGYAAGHGFQQDHAEGLVITWLQDAIGMGKDGLHVIDFADIRNPVADF